MYIKILFISLYLVINCTFLISQNDAINKSTIDKKYQSDYTNVIIMYKMNLIML